MVGGNIKKNEATVSRWCTNESQPSLETLIEIAKAFNVDVKDFYFQQRFENCYTMKETPLYYLPSGWAISTIENLIGVNGLFVDGDWIESKDQNPNGKVKLIQLADIGDGTFKNKSNRFMSLNRAMKLHCTFLQYGDILVARMPEPLGRAVIFPYNDMNLYVTVVDVAIIRTGKGVYNKWLMYFLNSPNIRKNIGSFQTGTTRKRISRSSLAKINVPVPPLKEQYRIVEKIDELFSEIEYIETNIYNIKKRLDLYWQTTIYNYFRGHLSKDWHEEAAISKIESINSIYEIPKTWDWVALGQYAHFIGTGSTPKGGRSVYTNRGVPFIRSQNVLHYSLDLDNVVYISVEQNEKMSRTQTQIYDVLFNITGASIGRCAYIPKKLEQGNVNQHVCIIRTKPALNYKYLSLYLNSPAIQCLIKNWSKGATREYLTLSQIKNIPVPLCSLQEQEFIVSELESKYTILENIKKILENKIYQINVLRQFILNKALEGRLVSQNPNDEPATDLLNKIRLERVELTDKVQIIKNVKIEIEKMERTKSINDILKETNKPLSAKEIWLQSKHWENIDNFYAELKSISDSIEQIKSKNEILLSLKK